MMHPNIHVYVISEEGNHHDTLLEKSIFKTVLVRYFFEDAASAGSQNNNDKKNKDNKLAPIKMRYSNQTHFRDIKQNACNIYIYRD